jgi:SAM-dependent methyltransferase
VNPLRSIFYSLPAPFRFLVRRLFYFPSDLLNSIRRKRHRYEPPKGKIFIGSGDFIQQGRYQVELLKKYADLQSHHHVLDIGSGIGRTAAALTEYLSDQAVYEGFDVVRAGVEWCKKRITRDHPQFHFRHVPLNNDLYTVKSNDAQVFRFPYPDRAFDVTFLFSVFTHMLPGEIANYLSEIQRTLKPDGKCLATFFLYDEATEKLISDPGYHFSFPHDYGYYRLMNDKVKSANVALSLSFLQEMTTQSGMHIEIHVNGDWKGKQADPVYFQDLVLFRVGH